MCARTAGELPLIGLVGQIAASHDPASARLAVLPRIVAPGSATLRLSCRLRSPEGSRYAVVWNVAAVV